MNSFARNAIDPRNLILILVAFAVQATALAQSITQSHLALSIYHADTNGDGLFEAADSDASSAGGYAIVREQRRVELKAGSNSLQLRDVPRYLDVSALSVRALDGGDAVVVNQRFDDDAISFDALVKRETGHIIEVSSNSNNPNGAVVSGTLLSNDGGLSLQLTDGRVTTLTDYGRVTFPDLPKGMSSAPSLRWEVSAPQAGAQTFELVYPTEGLAWRAEYSAWFEGDADCKLNLAGWALLANRSGTAYRAAHVTFVTVSAKARAEKADDTANEGSRENVIDAPVDIADNSLQRVALFPAQPANCERRYLFEATRFRANPAMAPITDRAYGLSNSLPTQAMLALHIDRELPAGRVRVIAGSNAANPHFVGEEKIERTPANDVMLVRLGEAPDLRGERRQTDMKIDKDARTLTESFHIALRNAGSAAKNVAVRDHLYRWSQWTLLSASSSYEKKSADTVEFKLDVPANESAGIDYTVQYYWKESFK